jgi:hypothetical protein
MTRWLYKPAPSVVPARPLLTRATVEGRCTCGVAITIGDDVYFDRKTGQIASCGLCAQRHNGLGMGGQLPLKNRGDALQVIDRVKQLKMLPRPLSSAASRELWQLVLRLKTELVHKTEVERFSLELAQRRFPQEQLMVNVTACQSQCVICRQNIRVGVRVVSAIRIKKSLCLTCPIELEDLY